MRGSGNKYMYKKSTTNLRVVEFKIVETMDCGIKKKNTKKKKKIKKNIIGLLNQRLLHQSIVELKSVEPKGC